MTAIVLLIGGGGLLLAFSNGANDNFKGFATVWGSETLTYRRALVLATLATAAGSISSLFLAHELVQKFSGKGLVPDSIASSHAFMISVVLGAGTTVMVASRMGMPVSTTHALLGGLIGAGLALALHSINLAALGTAFVLPLLLSPIISASAAFVLYGIITHFRTGADCACIVETQPALAADRAMALASAAPLPVLITGRREDCDRTAGVRLRISLPAVMDRLHILSGLAICFARAVNDTPKIAAILAASMVLGLSGSVTFVAVAIAVGGMVMARRVAETMSFRINRMDHAQGVTANLITAGLVLFASNLGLPVSTTHVSVGSIAGVGAGARTLDRGELTAVLLSWAVTLPFAAAAAWAIATLLQMVRI